MRCNRQTSGGQTEQQEAKQDGHIKGCGLQYTNAASKYCKILEENWELKTNRKLDDNHEDEDDKEEDDQDDEEEDDQESGRKDIEDGQARELQWKCLCPSALHTICVSLQTVFFNLPYSLYFTQFPSIWDCTDTVLANFMLRALFIPMQSKCLHQKWTTVWTCVYKVILWKVFLPLCKMVSLPLVTSHIRV